MPQALRPSCSSMCRLPVSTSCAATRPPLDRPPTKASAPSSGDRTSASDSVAPSPESRVTGRPSRGHQRVRQRQGDRAALGGRLGHHRVAGQQLHQLGVHLHAHRVVPAGDVADRPGQRLRGRTAGRRTSVPSICSISCRYQRTPSSARSTSAQASRHGLPISQASSRARSSRASASASTAAVTRAWRSASGVVAQSMCASAAAAPPAARSGRRPWPATDGRAVDRGDHRRRVTRRRASCPPYRFRSTPSPNASGARCAARPSTAVN